jgi:uncharacterized protein
MPSVHDNPAESLISRREEIRNLRACIKQLYASSSARLSFHSWDHVKFVFTKSVEFAAQRGADEIVVGAAALVHDLDRFENLLDKPSTAQRQRQTILSKSGFDQGAIDRVETCVVDAHTATRNRSIAIESQCLSDADTLFKALPITPVLLSHRYLIETGMSIRELAEKIHREQAPKLEDNFYFYDQSLAKKYLPWARSNLALWSAILESLDDETVSNLVLDIWPTGDAPRSLL